MTEPVRYVANNIELLPFLEIGRRHTTPEGWTTLQFKNLLADDIVDAYTIMEEDERPTHYPVWLSREQYFLSLELSQQQ